MFCCCVHEDGLSQIQSHISPSWEIISFTSWTLEVIATERTHTVHAVYDEEAEVDDTYVGI